ncbi:MAG: GNAT family N-acetyltransferase [Anaerolineales bacterium]|nr:GNAT family N-acetyltransferase [Anaerolineales bacterium]
MEKKMNAEEVWRSLENGYWARHAIPDDLKNVTKLINISSLAMIGKEDISIEEMRNEWETPGLNLETDTRVVFNGDDKLVGYTDVWDVSDTPVHPFVWGRVLPEYEGRGIGSAMLMWAIDRAKHAIGRVPENARVAARAFAVSTYEPSKRLLESQGMNLIRHSWQMLIDLDDDIPAPQWPEGIALRAYNHKQDAKSLYLTEEEAFSDHWGFVPESEEEGFERWLHHNKNDEEFDPTLWFLAMDGDEIAGAARCRIRSWEDPDTGWVRTIFVRRAWRRKGLALALLNHSFGELKSRGKERAGLGVDAESLTGATRLYEKAGMRINRQYDLYELELRPGEEIGKENL